MPFELYVALRYLVAKRRQAGISVISLLSILGVTVGVMAVIVALALMTGLQQELRDRILGSQAHVYVWKPSTGIGDYHAEAEKLLRVPHVVGAAPAILGQALAFVAGETTPIQLKGIDPRFESRVTDIASAMRSGSLAGLEEEGGSGVVLGKELAEKLRVKVGDDISVLTPQGTLSPMGLFPRTRRLRVVGTFSLGWYEFDTTFGFVSLDVAKRLFDKHDVDLMQLRVDRIYDAPQIAESIASQFGSDYYVQDWGDMNRSLFDALRAAGAGAGA
jgi:lipoprotein-releasing system permease protein